MELDDAEAVGRQIDIQGRNFLAFTGLQAPADSIFILVMGMTGSGKSTFISLCTGQDVVIGHELYSCTADMAIFDFRLGGRTVYLIDSPGYMIYPFIRLC
jgi:predicted GTPase